MFRSFQSNSAQCTRLRLCTLRGFWTHDLTCRELPNLCLESETFRSTKRVLCAPFSGSCFAGLTRLIIGKITHQARPQKQKPGQRSHRTNIAHNHYKFARPLKYALYSWSENELCSTPTRYLSTWVDTKRGVWWYGHCIPPCVHIQTLVPPYAISTLLQTVHSARTYRSKSTLYAVRVCTCFLVNGGRPSASVVRLSTRRETCCLHPNLCAVNFPTSDVATPSTLVAATHRPHVVAYGPTGGFIVISLI